MLMKKNMIRIAVNSPDMQVHYTNMTLQSPNRFSSEMSSSKRDTAGRRDERGKGTKLRLSRDSPSGSKMVGIPTQNYHPPDSQNKTSSVNNGLQNKPSRDTLHVTMPDDPWRRAWHPQNTSPKKLNHINSPEIRMLHTMESMKTRDVKYSVVLSKSEMTNEPNLTLGDSKGKGHRKQAYKHSRKGVCVQDSGGASTWSKSPGKHASSGASKQTESKNYLQLPPINTTNNLTSFLQDSISETSLRSESSSDSTNVDNRGANGTQVFNLYDKRNSKEKKKRRKVEFRQQSPEIMRSRETSGVSSDSKESIESDVATRVKVVKSILKKGQNPHYDDCGFSVFADGRFLHLPRIRTNNSSRCSTEPPDPFLLSSSPRPGIAFTCSKDFARVMEQLDNEDDASSTGGIL